MKKRESLESLLTIIVPTYNRREYVKKQYDWISREKLGQLIVVDGSESPDPFFKGKKNYYHLPVPVLERIQFAIKMIKTPYVVICADDDYLIYSGVDEVIKAMQKQPEFISGSGKVGTFIRNDGNVDLYSAIFSYRPHAKTDFKDKSRYLSNRMKNYIYSIYSIHRIDIFEKIVNSIPQEPGFDIAVELAFNISGTWYGKHYVDCSHYSVFREILPDSGGRKALPFSKLIKQDTKRWSDWLNRYTTLLSGGAGPVSEVREFIEIGFNSYLAFLRKRRAKSIFKYVLGKVFSFRYPSGLEKIDQEFFDSTDCRELVEYIRKSR